MKLDFNILFYVLAAFSVVGVVQWLKSLAKNIIASWRVPLVSAIVSFAVAFAAGGAINQILINGVIVLAFVELGWSIIVKTVFNLIGKIGGSSVQLDAKTQNTLDTIAKVLPKEEAENATQGQVG